MSASDDEDRLGELMMAAWPFEFRTDAEMYDASIVVCALAETLAPLVALRENAS